MATHSMSVVYLVPSITGSGANMATVEQALAIQAMGAHVTLVAHRALPSSSTHAVPTLTMPVNSNNPLRLVWAGYQLAKMAKKNNHTLWHATTRSTAWTCYIASWFYPIPFVVTIHALYTNTTMIHRAWNAALWKARAIIAVSSTVHQSIMAMRPSCAGKMHIVHSTPPLAPFNPDVISPERCIQAKKHLRVSDTNRPTLMVVPGRLTRSKGPMYLLDVLAHVPHKKWLCIFVGAPKRASFMSRFKKKVARHTLTDHIIVRPTYDDMPALYAVCDIVICPSIHPEALGRTIIEGQAAQRLVISTDIGHACHTIDHQKTGLLMSASCPRHAARIIHHALCMSSTEKRAIEHAACIAVTHTYTNPHNQIMDIYTNVHAMSSTPPGNTETLHVQNEPS